MFFILGGQRELCNFVAKIALHVLDERFSSLKQPIAVVVYFSSNN